MSAGATAAKNKHRFNSNGNNLSLLLFKMWSENNLFRFNVVAMFSSNFIVRTSYISIFCCFFFWKCGQINHAECFFPIRGRLDRNPDAYLRLYSTRYPNQFISIQMEQMNMIIVQLGTIWMVDNLTRFEKYPYNFIDIIFFVMRCIDINRNSYHLNDKLKNNNKEMINREKTITEFKLLFDRKKSPVCGWME